MEPADLDQKGALIMATHDKRRHEQEPAAASGHELSKPGGVPATEHRGPLARQGGFEPLRQMRDEFDRMFDRFFRTWPSVWEGGNRSNYWGFDIEDKDDVVMIRAEAPGFEPGDFDLQVRGNQLVLSASHREEPSEKDKDKPMRQWSHQELFRSVTLPAEVTAEKVDANYRNGVLTVTLPKTTPRSSQRIKVQG